MTVSEGEVARTHSIDKGRKGRRGGYRCEGAALYYQRKITVI